MKASCLGWLALSFALSAKAELVTNLVPVADTSLLESVPDNNLGGLPSIPAGTTQLGRSRALFKFDLSGIPPGAISSAAELSIVAVAENSQHPGSVFALYRVLRDWGEGTGSISNAGDPATTNAATWNNRFYPVTLWGLPGSAAGVDYVSAFSATNYVDPLTNYTFSSTAMATDVQLWVNNSATNFGWIFISQSEATNFTVRRFASREDPILHPVLTVHYIPPPVISAISVTGKQIHFSFTAESNRTYTVETRNSIAGGQWAVLTNIPVQPATTTIQISDSITNQTGFYRVRSP